MNQKSVQESSGGRTLVNALGIPFILLMIYLGGWAFWSFVTVVSILAMREFYSLGHKRDVRPHFILGCIATFMITLHFYFGPGHPIKIFRPGEILLFMVPLIILAELLRGRNNAMSNIATTLGGILYIPFLMGSMIGLREIDPIAPEMGLKLTFCLFAGVWACDSAAFVVGMKWGKEKLMERVSPKKTVAGGVGGLVAAFLFFIIIMQTGFLNSQYTMASVYFIDFLMFTVIIGIIGQAGDFAESLIKRDMGVKDTSSFLAGHGGILDRFDSLIIASPVMYLYVKYFIY